MYERDRSHIAAFGLLAAIMAAWSLQHPYDGIENNDASLYTVLALARLHPESVAHDVFLRFGSQDSFTIFSPLYAWVVKLLDLEPATALLAWISQIAFFVSAWLLARRLMPARLALLSVGLLVVLPSTYSSHDLFGYVEDFLTPRQIAEALVLAALTAFLARRYLIVGLCFLSAASLHPIMTLAGVVMMPCIAAVERPRAWIGAAVLLVLASLLPFAFISTGPFTRVDPTWLELVLQFASYLLISNWPLPSWGHLAVAVAVLGAGSLGSTVPAIRNICRAALLLGAAAVLVTLIYCDWLHVLIFVQIQPWRWLWLVETVAVIVLPIVIMDCWKAGTVGRATATLIASAWILRDFPAALVISSLSILCAALTERLERPSSRRLVLLGAGALLVLAVAINIEPKLLYVPVNPTSPDPTRIWLPERARGWLGDGIFCAGVLACAYWLTERAGSWSGRLILMSTSVAACAVLLPLAWGSWTAFHYTEQRRAQFAPWRALIPEQAETIWPGTPVGAWYLLERPSYYSHHQIAGDIFSRQKTVEIRRRGHLIQAALRTADPAPQPAPQSASVASASKVELPRNADGLDQRGLAAVCEDPALGFVVSWKSLGPTPFEPITPFGARPGSQLHLYRCADVLSMQSPSRSAALRH